MIKTTSSVSAQDYNLFKSLSTHKEKDELIFKWISYFNENSIRDESVENAFGEWKSSQIEKAFLSVNSDANNDIDLHDLFIAFKIYCIDPENINVGIRNLGSYLEFWIICSTKNYDIYETAVEIVDDYSFSSKKRIDCILTSQEDIADKDQVRFDKIIK